LPSPELTRTRTTLTKSTPFSSSKVEISRYISPDFFFFSERETSARRKRVAARMHAGPEKKADLIGPSFSIGSPKGFLD
jgi:hypothetical protein